jgi:predicted hydrocarbon binding protein
MYSVGLEWGKLDSLQFESWFEKEFGMSPRRANLMFLLETWWWPYISQGWGRWEVDMSDRKQGFMFINLFDSAVARTLGDVGKPVCHLYAGLFRGVLYRNGPQAAELHRNSVLLHGRNLLQVPARWAGAH